MPRKAKAAVADQEIIDNHRRNEGAAAPGADQHKLDNHTVSVGTEPKASDVGQPTIEPHLGHADSLAPIIAEIRAWHRVRMWAMESRKAEILRLGALLRMSFGWSRTLPKEESDAINARAKNLIKRCQKLVEAAFRKAKKAKIDPLAPDVLFAQAIEKNSDADFIAMGALVLRKLHSLQSDQTEDESTKQLEQLAATLPVWAEFGEPIKGFSPRFLGTIIAETGDLSLYANPGKIWKRMGLAPITKDGVTRAGSTWARMGGLSKEDWIAAGYCKHRLSKMFVIVTTMMKQQSPYRTVYLQEKQRQRKLAAEGGLTVAPANKIPAKRKDEFISDGHINFKALRYMAKRLLKDLWQAWRRARVHLSPTERVPAPNSDRQTTLLSTPNRLVSAARSAEQRMPTKVALPSASIPAKAGKRRAAVRLSSIEHLPAASSKRKRA